MQADIGTYVVQVNHHPLLTTWEERKLLLPFQNVVGYIHTEGIFEGLEAGVDVFESSYAYLAAETGHAVVFGAHKWDDELHSQELWPFEIDLKEKR